MSPNRLLLIIVCVLGAAAATVYVGAALIASTLIQPFFEMAVLIIISLCVYIGWRVIAERPQNKDDDDYDNFKN
jgi:membrane protein implicated in regulation of membrane protease activity